ncbi:MAG: hypothetical protein R3C05_22210 [Pirellulaceae bacterium]
MDDLRHIVGGAALRELALTNAGSRWDRHHREGLRVIGGLPRLQRLKLERCAIHDTDIVSLAIARLFP